MPKTQAMINADKINNLILSMKEIEGKQEVISCEVLKLIDIIEKLTDRIKDIDMNMRAIYLHLKDQDKLKKENWFF